MRYYHKTFDVKWSNGYFQENYKYTTTADSLEEAEQRVKGFIDQYMGMKAVFTNIQPIVEGLEVSFTDLNVSSYSSNLFVEARGDGKYFLVVPEPNNSDEVEISKELHDLLVKELKIEIEEDEQ